jgi:hypothetical protein
MLLLFEAMVELPPVFARPHSQGAWGGAMYNLVAIGAYWIFLESVASRRQADGGQISAAGEAAAISRDSAIA